MPDAGFRMVCHWLKLVTIRYPESSIIINNTLGFHIIILLKLIYRRTDIK